MCPIAGVFSEVVLDLLSSQGENGLTKIPARMHVANPSEPVLTSCCYLALGNTPLLGIQSLYLKQEQCVKTLLELQYWHALCVSFACSFNLCAFVCICVCPANRNYNLLWWVVRQPQFFILQHVCRGKTCLYWAGVYMPMLFCRQNVLNWLSTSLVQFHQKKKKKSIIEL